MSIASPCKNICQMHEPSGQCIGCGRTLDEIALWSVLDDDDKQAVWALLPARLEKLPPPPDGSQSALKNQTAAIKPSSLT